VPREYTLTQTKHSRPSLRQDLHQQWQQLEPQAAQPNKSADLPQFPYLSDICIDSSYATVILVRKSEEKKKKRLRLNMKLK